MGERTILFAFFDGLFFADSVGGEFEDFLADFLVVFEVADDEDAVFGQELQVEGGTGDEEGVLGAEMAFVGGPVNPDGNDRLLERQEVLQELAVLGASGQSEVDF